MLLAFFGWQAQPQPAVTTYRLYLMTSAGENQALETTDEGEVDELRGAIEDAMARSA